MLYFAKNSYNFPINDLKIPQGILWNIVWYGSWLEIPHNTLNVCLEILCSGMSYVCYACLAPVLIMTAKTLGISAVSSGHPLSYLQFNYLASAPAGDLAAAWPGDGDGFGHVFFLWKARLKCVVLAKIISQANQEHTKTNQKNIVFWNINIFGLSEVIGRMFGNDPMQCHDFSLRPQIMVPPGALS